MDDESPWARDDWSPEEHEPVEFGAPSDAIAAPGGGRTSAETRRDRRVFAALALVGLAVVATVLITRGGGGREDSAARGAPSTVGPTATLAAVTSTTSTSSTTTPPAADVDGSGPAATTTGPPPIYEIRSGDGDRTVRALVPAAVGVQPDLVRVIEGEVPTWTEWWLEVPEELASMPPVELLVAGRAVLHRVELPSGRVESVSILAEWDGQTQVGRLTNGLVYSAFSDVWVLVDGSKAHAERIGQTTALWSRPSGGAVVRTEPLQFEEPGTWLVGDDGTVADVSVPGQAWMWGGGLNSAGEVVGGAPGGMYAVDVVAGTARRIVDARPIVVGATHALVERCDGELHCEMLLVDTATGATSVPNLGEIDPYGAGLDAMSPDGTKALTYRVPGGLTVVDLRTGTTTRLDNELWLSTDRGWLPDSDGLLMMSPLGLAVVRLDGTFVVIPGINNVLDIVVTAM